LPDAKLPVVARLKWAVRVLLLFAAALLLLGTRFFTRWPQVYYMTGSSMEPAVRAHEYFLTSSPVGQLARGMLVIFRYEDEDGVFHVLRRLAALPGDTILMREGHAMVGGRDDGVRFRILAPEAHHSPLARSGELFTWGPVVVPRDSVFLLSDTRDMIGWPDSRFLGAIAIDRIEARATRIVWPRVLRKAR
jgi:signal peptidase I